MTVILFHDFGYVRDNLEGKMLQKYPRVRSNSDTLIMQIPIQFYNTLPIINFQLRDDINWSD